MTNTNSDSYNFWNFPEYVREYGFREAVAYDLSKTPTLEKIVHGVTFCAKALVGLPIAAYFALTDKKKSSKYMG
ncbi:MAG: hypothetical protein ABSG05_01075 [Candidatus Pacearchaeota archaeon]|jgi:hypothetical protein